MTGDNRSAAWRARNRSVLLLSLIPYLGFFAFLRMGRKANRPEYTMYGVIYAAAAFICAMAPIFLPMANGALEDVLTFLSFAGVFILWLVTAIHTFASGGSYLTYLSAAEEGRMPPHVLLSDTGWKFKNSLWLIWGILPFTGGLALCDVGRRLKKPVLHAFGGLYLLAVFVHIVIGPIVQDAGADFNSPLMMFFRCLENSLIIFYLFSLPVLCFFLRPCLEQRAAIWENDTALFPRLGEAAWRRSNSGWQLWTFCPYVGGIGLAWAGVKSRSKQVLWTGIAVNILYGLLILTQALVGRYLVNTLGMNDVDAAFTGSYQAVGCAISCLYVATLFLGTMLRWEALRGKAEALMGFSSEAEREVVLQRRAAGPLFPAKPAAKKEKKAAPKTEPAEKQPDQPRRPGSRLDITMTGESLKAPAVPAEAAAPAAPQPEAPHRPAARLDITMTGDMLKASAKPMAEPAPAAPAAPQQEPVPSASSLLNINTCTAAELLNLPGISMADAKRAVEHRQTAGAFASVDDFVDYLGVKPHFAVQIFELATAEQPAAAKPAGKPAASNRVLDL